jgi:uncharacterized protein YdaU (DUF1376 family)
VAHDTAAWMPVYVADYLADTGHLSAAEHGAYLLLLMHYWRTASPLSSQEEQLRRIARMSLDEWQGAAPTILAFFRLGEDGLYHHKRVDAELARAVALVEQRSNAGKASAERRRQRNPNDRSTNVATGEPTERQRNARPSPTPSPPPIVVDVAGGRACVDEILPTARDAVLDALGCRNDPNWFGDAGRVEAWLRDGADLERDILPTVKRIMAGRSEPPRSLKYFDRAIADAKASRESPLPAGQAKPGQQPALSGAEMLARAKY